MSESMSGVEPEIRLGSEPRRAERPPGDLGGAGRAVSGEEAFVERALAILSRQDRPSAVPGVPPTGAAAPAGCPPAIETLRQQAVDWIDSFLTLVTVGVAPTPVTTNLVAVGAGSPAAPGLPSALPSALVPAALSAAAAAPATLSMLPAGAGQVVARTLRIANDGALDAPLRFIATDLVGDSGARIPASAVTFVPAAAVVAAHAVRAVDVFVAIPAGIPAGAYAGLLQLIGQPLARSLLAVNVTSEPASGLGARP